MAITPRLGDEQRVYYRPIEAAIRWSGLLKHEPDILQTLGTRFIPEPTDFPPWPALRLNAERIYDGLANGELRYGRRGITDEDGVPLNDPGLTVRHVDLKAWMVRFYPDQRPSFLFDDVERDWHPAVSLHSVQTLLADREALKVELADHERAEATLRSQLQALSAERDSLAKQYGTPLGPRAESTYLNIVGGLLDLLVGKSPGGNPYSSFRSVEAVVNAMLAHHSGRPGMSERTLRAKFTAARHHLSASDP